MTSAASKVGPKLPAGGLPFNPTRIEKPWGYELIWAETARYAGKILHIEQGHQLSLQYHEAKDETIHLLAGILEIEIGTSTGPRQALRLHPGESLNIPPQWRHRLRAIETCDVVEASSPELDDLVRLEDRYGRID